MSAFGWMPMTVRPPDAGQLVLVCEQDGTRHIARRVYVVDDEEPECSGWCWEDIDGSAIDHDTPMTHWKRLTGLPPARDRRREIARQAAAHPPAGAREESPRP